MGEDMKEHGFKNNFERVVSGLLTTLMPLSEGAVAGPSG